MNTIKMHEQTMVAMKGLHLADYNPRSISSDAMVALKKQLSTTGLVEPVVARAEDGLVIGGHQRLAAIRSLLEEQGATKKQIDDHRVAVVLVPGLSDIAAKALNLALNKISGDWDYTKLPEILRDISAAVDGIDVDATGFSVDEISSILGLLEGDDALGRDPVNLEEEIAEGLANQARRFAFVLENDADASLANEVLRGFGMTGPGNAGAAFMKAIRAAQARPMEN